MGAIDDIDWGAALDQENDGYADYPSHSSYRTQAYKGFAQPISNQKENQMPKKAKPAKSTRKKTAATKRATKKSKPAASKLESFLKSITRQFQPLDHVAPGLVLSALPSGKFYGSIARYQGQHKIVVDSACGDSLLEVLTSLSKTWKAYLDYQKAREKPITRI